MEVALESSGISWTDWFDWNWTGLSGCGLATGPTRCLGLGRSDMRPDELTGVLYGYCTDPRYGVHTYTVHTKYCYIFALYCLSIVPRVIVPIQPYTSIRVFYRLYPADQ
jgi:hypothetical protein